MSLRLCLAGLLSLGIGCGQQPAESAGGSASAVAEPTETAGSGTPDSAQQAALLTELTQAVRRYAVEQRRAPKNLEELVAQGYLTQTPPAPPGQRYAIDKNLQVHLANQ